MTTNHNSLNLINKIIKGNKIKDYQVFDSKYITGLPNNSVKNIESVTILVIKNVDDKQKIEVMEQIRFWCADNIENLCKRKTNIINPFWQFGIKYRNNFCLKVHGIVVGFEGECDGECVFCEVFNDKSLNKSYSFWLKALENKEILKMAKQADEASDKILFANFN